MSRKRRSTVYIILIYVSFVLFLAQQGVDGNLMTLLFLVCTVVTVSVGGVHTARDVKFIKHRKLAIEFNLEKTLALKELAKLKYMTIPFFILNFVYWVILMLVPMGFIFAIFIPIDFIFIYSIIITSGVTGIKTLMLCKQAGETLEGKISLYSVLMFIPVLDVFATIALRKKLL